MLTAQQIADECRRLYPDHDWEHDCAEYDEPKSIAEYLINEWSIDTLTIEQAVEAVMDYVRGWSER